MGRYFDELTVKMKKINSGFLEEVRDRFGENIGDEVLAEMIGNIYAMEMLEDEMEAEMSGIDYELEDAEYKVSEANSL